MTVAELWSDLRYRVRAWFARDTVERELDDELRFHLEREAHKLERHGAAPEAARRHARLRFGGVEVAKEGSRDARGTALLDTTLRDIRYALRGLRARPGFAFGVVATLALGIGANAAMLGAVDRLLFRPPAYLRDPGRVHRVYEVTNQPTLNYQETLQFPRYLDLARSTSAFSTVAAFADQNVAVRTGDDTHERPVSAVSGNFFDLFDARPLLGRFLMPSDDAAPRGSPVAVVGYTFWREELGGRRDVVGQTLLVGRTLCTIVGVAPERFGGLGENGAPAAFVPLTTFAWTFRGPDIRKGYDYTTNYGWHWLGIAVHTKAGVSDASAEADLSLAFARSWQADYVSPNPRRPSLESLRPRGLLGPVQSERGPNAGPSSKVALWIGGVAVIVLLIACANVSNLLLLRTVARRREIGLRLALGVSRSRLARQLFTETLVLAVLGGAAGLGAAQWGSGATRALFKAPGTSTTIIDMRTVVIGLTATVLATIVTGFAPIVHALRGDVASILASGGRDSGGHRSAIRASLVMLQATLSVVLLVGAGLFARSLHNVRATRLGFDIAPILAVDVITRGVAIPSIDQIGLEERLVQSVASLPGVIAATQSPSVPFWGFEGRYIYVPGVDSADNRANFLLQAGNADFFKTYGTRIVRGRAFDERDTRDAARVVVVSEGMANLLWPGQDPLGKCIRISADTMPCTNVIGVAEEMQTYSLQPLPNGKNSYTYTIPIAQYADGPAGTVVVRTAGNAASYTEIVRKRLQALMPGATYVKVRPFQTIVDPKMESWRLGAWVFTAFAGLALVIASVGLYSSVAYGVAQRRKEIGVRIALGASWAKVARMVVLGAIRIVLGGVLCGAAVALLAGRWAEPLLFHESPSDPLVYAGVAAALISVALAASAVPAIVASRVDPNLVLRGD